MSKLIERITVIRRDGKDPEPVTVYRRSNKKRKGSFLLRPVERAARSLVRAQIVFGQEVLRRHDQANSRRRDGWLLEAPAIVAKSGRKAYNEGRKGVPFKILPKA
jgi:Family of unknown function (DUF6312)